LVRVANNGISGVIDPAGRVLARTRLDAIGYADIALPQPGAPTLYGVTGDWLFVAMLALGLLPIGLRRAG
jgi:apolipoprotein N-acyltransferase